MSPSLSQSWLWHLPPHRTCTRDFYPTQALTIKTQWYLHKIFFILLIDNIPITPSMTCTSMVLHLSCNISSSCILSTYLGFTLSYLSSPCILPGYPNFMSSYLSSPCTLSHYLDLPYYQDFLLSYPDILRTWGHNVHVLNRFETWNTICHVKKN